MTEPAPTYATAAPDDDAGQPLAEVGRLTPLEGADLLAAYLMRRREMLITELREIDRLLRRPQTVPERLR